MKNEKNNPIKTFRDGLISVSVFENNVKLKSGEKTIIPNAVFQKRYKDDKNEWHTTNKLNASEITKAIKCLQDAEIFLKTKKD